MTRSKSILGTAGLALAMLASTTAFAADGAAARGETLSRRWCAECHVVAADQTRASSDAPSFFALTGETARSPDALAAYLALPDTVHSRMPDLHLSRAEIAEIVAYVASLTP